MIIFTFETDIVNDRVVYYLGTTDCTGEDKHHSTEIYEQLDAQASGLADE